MSQLAPTASGTLAATPLGHLLIHAFDRRLTGSLVFEETDHSKHAVYLANGAPAAARTSQPVALLGALAVEHGVIGADRIEPAVEAATAAGRRLGELLRESAVLDEVSLDALLREQVERRLQHIRGLSPETAYGYYDGRNFLERAGGPSEPCPALPLIWHVMRITPDHGRGAETLARLRGTTLRFHVDAPLASFDFGAGERAVVDVLRAKPQTLAELAGRDLLEPALLERLVYTLLLLRQFDLGTGGQPLGSDRRSMSPAFVALSMAPGPVTPVPGSVTEIDLPPSVPSVPPPPPADDPLRREAEERAQASEQSFYEVLGIPYDAPASAIATAYFQLAKRWHPDRLAAEHADLHDMAVKIFARIGEAHQTLSDAERRKQYDAELKQGDEVSEEQEQVQRLLRAATNFQKAQVLLRRNNLPAAEEAARAALEDAPDEADHIALVAWLDAAKPGADLDALLGALNRATKLEDANLRVRWYRGQVLKRLGRERQAMEDFRLIVEKDPRHVDAQRELRLYDMRRGKKQAGDSLGDRRSETHAPPRPQTAAPPNDKKPNFFGKLFKK
jgi:curved DNA-binding protein CbpA